jgi:hypothetical protein
MRELLLPGIYCRSAELSFVKRSFNQSAETNIKFSKNEHSNRMRSVSSSISCGNGLARNPEAEVKNGNNRTT